MRGSDPLIHSASLERVVVTGLGIISCIGNDLDSVTDALLHARSGIRFMPDYAELGLNSQVAGVPDIDGLPTIERRYRRFMGDAAVYAYHAMQQAVDDAQLPDSALHDARTALIVGSGVGSPFRHHEAMTLFKAKGLSKVSPCYVPQIMGSTVSANLSMAFGIAGPSYSITAACASAAHCIGNATELIRHGMVDRAFAGGAEEVCWTTTVPFDAMGALSTRWNASPATASRPFDAGRDGFVIAGGAGMLLLESESAARRRGARIYGEVAGYAASSDRGNMVQTHAAGITRTMQAALLAAGAPTIDYVNPHATSTPGGDAAELAALRTVFANQLPAIAATKGLTGHPIAAAGAHSAIVCLLAMQRGFIPTSANLFQPDPAAADIPLVRSSRHQPVCTALANSLGFGGTNATLVFRRI